MTGGVAAVLAAACCGVTVYAWQSALVTLNITNEAFERSITSYI